MKLTHRLFGLALVALAPAIGLQIYNELALRDAREAEVRELALRTARQAASEIERVFEGARYLLTALGQEASVQAFETQGCTAYLARVKAEMPHVAFLAAFDLEVRERCRQEPVSDEPSFADAAFVREALATGDFVIGEYTQDRVLRQPILPLAQPLRDASGRVSGVIGAALHLDGLATRLAERGVAPGGSVTVADKRGIILARVPMAERFIGTRIPEQFQYLLQAPEPGVLDVVSQDGVRRVLGYIPVGVSPKGVYVSAGLSVEEAYAAVDRAARRGLLLIAVGAALALLAAWAVGRRFIAGPVQRLLDVADAWRAGRLDARTRLEADQGEFGRLGAAFDGVMAALAARESALKESEKRFRELADSVPVLIWLSGPDKGGTYFNRPWLAFTGRPLEAELGSGWLDSVHPDDQAALEVCRQAFESRQPFQAEFRMRRHDGQWRWLLDTGVPRYGGGNFLGFIGSCVDITERKEAEERQVLLLHELNHRVKNTLATVQSLASQSRRAESPEDFHSAFEARLLALSKTHDLLTEQNWSGAWLSRLLAHEMSPYSDPAGRSRLAVSGTDVYLEPREALALGMALYELATNAAKYGALARPEGSVEVRWEVCSRPGRRAPRLRLTWTEQGGLEVHPPRRQGFGTRLIDRSIRLELGGQVDLDFDPAGLRVTMEVPLPGRTSEAGRRFRADALPV